MIDRFVTTRAGRFVAIAPVPVFADYPRNCKENVSSLVALLVSCSRTRWRIKRLFGIADVYPLGKKIKPRAVITDELYRRFFPTKL